MAQSEKRLLPFIKLNLLKNNGFVLIITFQKKQLKSYFKKAAHSRESTGSVLLGLIETRVDVAILRLGFAKTIYAARQYIAHGHFSINNQRVFTPSHQVKLNTEIAVTDKAKKHPQIIEALAASQEKTTPEYYTVNKVQMSGHLNEIPEREKIPTTVNEQLVVEYYSR